MTTPAGPSSTPSASGGRVGTNTAGGSRQVGPSASAIEGQIQSLMQVQLASTNAMLAAVREMTQEVRLGSLRTASASGDREAQAALAMAEGGVGSYTGNAGDVSRIGMAAQTTFTRAAGGLGTATAGQTRMNPDGSVSNGAPPPGAGAGGSGGVGRNPGNNLPAPPTPRPTPYAPYATSGSQLGKRAAQDLGARIRGNTDDPNFDPNSTRARLGNAIGQSGGTLGGLKQGVMNHLPGAGLVNSVTEKFQEGVESVMNQVYAGREIEAVEGPQSFMSQQRERAARSVYGYENMFSVGGERAQEQFNFATAQGMTGGERSRELRNMTSVATSTGASEEQVEDAFAIAAKNANLSLTQVTDGLKSVSSAAKDFGVNAKIARQAYIENLAAATGQGFGSAASGIAETQTNSITAMGRSMAGVSTEEGLSDSMLYRYAGQSGQSIGSVYAQSINTNGASLAQLQTNNTTAMIKAVIPPQIQSWIRDQIQKNGGAAVVRQAPAIMASIAQQMLTTFPNDLNPDFLQTFAKENLGLSNADPMQTLTYIVNQFAGNTTAAQAAQTNANHATTTSGLTLSAGANGVMPTTSNTGFANLATTNNGSRYDSHDYRSNVNALGGSKGLSNSTAQEMYLKASQSGGSRNSVVEGLLQSLGTNATKQLVQVQTKDGPKVVTMTDAVQDYQDQLASGQATIVGEGHVRNGKVQVTGVSAYQGQGVQQIVGYAATDSATTKGAANEATKAASTRDGSALTAAAAQSALADKAKNKGVTTLDLTPAAAAILTPLVNGSASQTSTAAGSMTAPSNYNGSIASNTMR